MSCVWTFFEIVSRERHRKASEWSSTLSKVQILRLETTEFEGDTRAAHRHSRKARRYTDVLAAARESVRGQHFMRRKREREREPVLEGGPGGVPVDFRRILKVEFWRGGYSLCEVSSTR